MNESTAPSLARRMACWIYEGMLLFAVLFVAAWLFSTLSQMRDGMDSRRHLFQGFVFIILGIYFSWFWAHGQTLAMKTWRIRVVDVHGRAVTQGRALLRYVLAWAWFLPPAAGIALFHISGVEMLVLLIGWVPVWALLSRFHPQQQFWHDALAGTRLVDSAPLSR